MCDNSLGKIWPDDIYFVVPDSGGEYVSDGGQIIKLPVSFVGWKIRVLRGNVPVDYNEQVPGDPYFEHNPAEQFLNIHPDAQSGDKFIIQAYKPAE